jgi:hypothetical protein
MNELRISVSMEIGVMLELVVSVIWSDRYSLRGAVPQRSKPAKSSVILAPYWHSYGWLEPLVENPSVAVLHVAVWPAVTPITKLQRGAPIGPASEISTW